MTVDLERLFLNHLLPLAIIGADSSGVVLVYWDWVQYDSLYLGSGQVYSFWVHLGYVVFRFILSVYASHVDAGLDRIRSGKFSSSHNWLPSFGFRIWY